MPMPSDTNEFGDVFAGWVMSQCDLAGAVPALLEAQSRVATVAVTNFTFKEPVYVGDVVSFYSRILKVGTTSITVDVDVFAERLLKDNYNIVHVTDAQLVYVALDAQGKKQKVDRPGKVKLSSSIRP
ncbi:MAG: acyl-CoA thioesterase [Burkholderiales bacterium]|nr:acyl-CoA thioesterase [Burkholderiales bacterium]